jgi:hypothetical protein
MKMRSFGVILGAIVMCQAGLADTDSHVQIIINQSPTKPAARSHVLKTQKSIAKKTKVKKLAPVATKATKTHNPILLVGKKPMVKKAIGLSQANSHPKVSGHIPGKRISLANLNSAHANSLAMEEEQELKFPQSKSSSPSLKTKVQQNEPIESQSNWEFQYKTNNAVNLNAVENYGPERDYTIQAWDRFYVTYNFSPNISLGLVGQYYHTWFQDGDRPQSSTNPGLTQSYASYLGDTGLAFNDKKITTLAGGIVLSGQASFYAPTSQSSQTAGAYGQTRTGLALSKSFGKIDLKWNEVLWYDWQRFDTNAYLSNSQSTIANPQYYGFSNLDITYNFSSKLSFTLEGGFINEANYGDSYNGIAGINNDYIEFNPELDYSFSKHFLLGLGVWEVYNTTNQPTVGGQTVSYYVPLAPYNGSAPGAWTSSQLYLLGSVLF